MCHFFVLVVQICIEWKYVNIEMFEIGCGRRMESLVSSYCLSLNIVMVTYTSASMNYSGYLQNFWDDFMFLLPDWRHKYLSDDETIDLARSCLYIRAYMQGQKSKSSKTHSCKDSTCRLTQDADIMKASSPLFLSIAAFIVIASFYETSEAFILSLSARKDQLRIEKLERKLEEEKIARRMQALEQEEQDVQRKLRRLQKLVQKYKAKSKGKVSLFFSFFRE